MGKTNRHTFGSAIAPGLITAEDGQVAVPFVEGDALLLLGFLNSRYAQSAIHGTATCPSSAVIKPGAIAEPKVCRFIFPIQRQSAKIGLGS